MARQHPNGALGVASLSITVHDLQASLARYRALLGEHIHTTVALPDNGVQVASVHLGTGTLVLAAQAGSAGPLAQRTDPAAGAQPAADLALSHGARIAYQA